MSGLFSIVLLVIVAALTPGAVILDGVSRGWTLRAGGAMRLDVGRRRLALVFYQYRPGRVYYRLEAGATT